METKDHIMFGEQLAHKYLKHAGKSERTAFLFGCVSPDINPFTYIKGSIKYQIFQGHNYLNAQKMTKHYMDKLSVSQFSACKDYYCLGKLIHYIADAFTFAHNVQFQGSMRCHVAYEHKLHETFMDSEQSKSLRSNAAALYKECDLFEYFTRTHQEYLKCRNDIWDDVHYIKEISEMVLINVLRNTEKNYLIQEVSLWKTKQQLSPIPTLQSSMRR